ncbi:unnamed protein product [Natator depressus]
MVEGDQGHKPGPSLSPLAMEIESEGLGAAAADEDDGRSSRCGSCRGEWFAMLEEQQRPGVQRAVPQVPVFHKRSPRASCDSCSVVRAMQTIAEKRDTPQMAAFWVQEMDGGSRENCQTVAITEEKKPAKCLPDYGSWLGHSRVVKLTVSVAGRTLLCSFM